MANDVFANGREISCKAGSGKTICAFPDVCFTPPENPATPPGVPIPYPNTGMASDMTSGSKKVKISNKEVMLKSKSYFKKSTGDEAGSAAKKGAVTSTNRGKVYFTSWSMDVKFEGENVVRHLDLTTHNHMSQPPNTPPWPYADTMAVAIELSEDKCKCCGKAMHSEAQRNGDSINEDEFYGTADNPNIKAKLEEIRNNPDCKNILPDPKDDECNKYYKTTPKDVKKTSKKWDRHKKRHGMKGQWAHKVPKAAGGCATGKNVAPVKPECKTLEAKMGKIQNERLRALGWR